MDIRDQYLQNSKHIYTDGSKSDQGGGDGAVLGNNVMKTASLLKESSIFSAEAYAIYLTLGICQQQQGENWIIYSDSLSVLRKLNNRTRHPMMRNLVHEVESQGRQNKNVQY